MTGPTSERNAHDDRQAPPPMPRWVKVVGILFIAFVLVIVVLHLMGRGFGGHG